MTDEYASTETANPQDESNALLGGEDAIDSSRIDGFRSAITRRAADGSLAAIGGGALVAMGVRSIARRRLRGVVQALVGVGLLRFGLARRRSADEPWEPSLDEFRADEDETEDETEDEYQGAATEGTDDKETSDDAHAAVERHDMGQQPGGDPGDLAEDFETDEAPSSDVSFVEDEDPAERTKPDLGADAEDPRRATDADGDEGVDVDVSEDAVAEEPGEATGPDPEQAQPAQTDATEPERSPEEDESRFDERPSTDGGPSDEDGDGDEDEDQLGQDETDAEGDSEAMSGEDEDGDATDDTPTADYEVDEDENEDEDEEGMNGP